jgi:hypothetical protein
VNPCPALDHCVKNAQASLGSLPLARDRERDSAFSLWTLAWGWFADSTFDLRALVRNGVVVSLALARDKAIDARCLLSLVCSGRGAWLLSLQGEPRSIGDGDWRPPEMMRSQPVQCLPNDP